MNVSKRAFALLALALAVPACTPPPAQPTSGTATSSVSKTKYNVTVNPVGPETWSYSITAQGSFVSVTFHSTSDISHCTLTSNGATPPQGATASVPDKNDLKLTANRNPKAGVAAGWTAITINLKCDMSNGPIDLLFAESTGAVATIGPVAGPH